MKRLTTAIALIGVLAVAAVAIAKTATLSGTYKTTISGKGANTLNGALDGTWKITLKKGKYTVTDNGKAEVNGNYKITGSTIALTDKGGPAKCAGTGKYKFKISGKTVSLTKVSDTTACAGRQAVLAHKFKKV